MNISNHDLAPISKLILKSFESKNIPLNEDMFSSGTASHGCGHVPRTVAKGFRMTATAYFAKPKNNLTIMTDTLVDKVRLEGNKAVGVETLSIEGSKTFFHAKREVIISAGTYSSPTILMRSGIGPVEQVKKHGIESLIELSGVGQNLQDHVVCSRLSRITQS